MNNWYAPHRWPEEKPTSYHCIAQDEHGRIVEAEYIGGRWTTRAQAEPLIVKYWWRWPSGAEDGDDSIDFLRAERDRYRELFYKQCAEGQEQQARADIATRKLRQIEQALRGEL